MFGVRSEAVMDRRRCSAFALVMFTALAVGQTRQPAPLPQAPTVFPSVHALETPNVEPGPKGLSNGESGDALAQQAAQLKKMRREHLVKTVNRLLEEARSFELEVAANPEMTETNRKRLDAIEKTAREVRLLATN